MSLTLNKTDLNRVRRIPERGHYDTATIYPIIDEALICHVGLIDDGQPIVIPTLHARDGDRILLHGAKASRLLKHVQSGGAVSIAITLLDGIVVARSVYNSSMNYRSVVLFGKGEPVSEKDKLAALERFTEHLIPGRWKDARQPNDYEMNATTIVAVPIDLASAKVRVGPPKDNEEDYDLPIWGGIIPVRQNFMTPQVDPKSKHDLSVPHYIAHYSRPTST